MEPALVFLFIPIRTGIAVFADFFLGPLPRQGLLHAQFLPRLQVERVTLYFLNDVFRLHFALEAPQGILNGFAFL